MRYQLELFFTALGFFTRLPVPGWVPYSPERLNASTRYFPLAGLAIAAIAAATLWLAAHLLPWPVAVLLAMIASLRASGVFHEDGLADSADGLGGGRDKTQVLAIMKDSCLGTYGTVTLVGALTLKFATLQALGLHGAVFALFAIHPFSRFCATLIIRALPYVRDDASSKSKPLGERIGGHELAIAALTGLAPLALLSPLRALAVLAAGLALTLWWGLLLRRRLGGFTGDCLGAAQQLAELAGYLVCCAQWTSP